MQKLLVLLLFCSCTHQTWTADVDGEKYTLNRGDRLIITKKSFPPPTVINDQPRIVTADKFTSISDESDLEDDSDTDEYLEDREQFTINSVHGGDLSLTDSEIIAVPESDGMIDPDLVGTDEEGYEL